MTAERLFLEFQRTRDPAPLGLVFDLCADDLFAVALHLCRDRAAAEDALQSTFLCAIERAHRYAAGRPLRPWLLGILHREVKVQRRRARRQPVAARLGTPADAPPERAAIDAESRSAVRGAIAALPEPYRAVLELRLVHELGNDAIAERLQRSPGAVRTQLWRGLELLRQLLPKGLALGLAAHLLGRPALAAVRARVFAAAAQAKVAAGAGAAGIGVALGGLLMKKLLLVGAAVAAFVFVAVQIPPRGAELASPPGPAGTVVAVAQARADGAPAEHDAPAAKAREGDAASRAVVETPAAPSVPAPPTQDVDLLIVDGKGDPVADAEVALYASDLKPGEQRLRLYAHRTGEPIAQLVADAAGRCHTTIHGECLIVASKAGVGTTGDVPLEPGMTELVPVFCLMLVQPVHVVGTVLLPDGAPAAGSVVRCDSNGWNQFARAAAPPPVLADARGAFALDLPPSRSFSIRALHGAHGSGVVNVDTYGSRVAAPIVLQIPGAFSLRGRLLDEDGTPQVGDVRMFGVRGAGGWVKSSADGAFEILLGKGGRFEVLGMVKDRTVAHQVVVLDAARPQQEVTLRVLPFAEVSGQLVDERGQPLGGLFVGTSPKEEYSELREIRFGSYDLPGGPAAADGTFHWLLPQEPLRIWYRPVPGIKDLYAQGPEIQPPATGLCIVVPDRERVDTRKGFVLRGRVVAAATQLPVTSFRVELITAVSAGSSSMGKVDCPVSADGTFATGLLRCGKDLTFEFEADGFAPIRVGPFHATERVEEVLVRLPAFAAFGVQVLRADGRPAAHAKVQVHSEALEPYGPTLSRETGADGRAQFENVWPRDWTLSAWMEGVEKDRVDREIALLPGENAPVQLLLRR